ncbi:MAG: CBS domain-containing protein [Planctomycetes bacterium]|nr:CBS domain-containing protein [Planctomycetota bacterium]
MLTVGEFLQRKGHEIATISPDATVLEAAGVMNDKHIGALTVLENDAIAGMFTERDVLNRVVAAQLDPATTKVRDVMTSPVVTCTNDSTVGACAAAMSEKKIRHLPVVSREGDTEKLIGIISTGDLMALDVSRKQAQIDHLHEYLHGRP